MQTFAAIDIGSNSCRLKIGRVVQHRLKTVHEDREVTRLGGSVFESGIVSPESMTATLRTLKRFYKAVQTHGADRGLVENEPGASGRCILFDLGGGSCEITLSEHKRIRETISLPLGAVRLTQEFLRSDIPEADEIRRLKQFMDRELRRARRRIPTDGVRLAIATSGTAAALSDAARALEKKRAKRASQELTPVDTVRKLTSRLTKMSAGERASMPGIG